MSVTINNTGSKSRQIVVIDEYHPAMANGVIDKINTCITDLGWSVYDSRTSGVNNCLVTKVYSAACDDGGSPSTKYMILRYDSPRQYFYLSCAESWNTSTGVATNECWTQNRGFPIPLSTNHYTLYIFASARYCVFQPVVRGEPGLWQGIFEFEREAYDDTASGAPCFGYTNGVIFGSPFYCLTTSTQGVTNSVESNSLIRNHVLPFWVPRLPTGETGLNAAKNSSIYVAGQNYPPAHQLAVYNSSFSTLGLANGYISNTYGTGIHALQKAVTPYKANGNIQAIMTPKFACQNTSNFFRAGRIYGLNLTYNFGTPMDTTVIPANSTTGLYDPAGSNTTHFVLSLTGGAQQTVAATNNQLTRDRLIFEYIDTETNAANTYSFFDAVITRGRFIYFTVGSTAWANNTAGYTQIKKYDLDTNKWNTIEMPGSVDSLVYDGGNNIYVSTNVGITKVNVDNNAIIANLNMASNLAGGAAALAIDDKYVYAIQRTATLSNNQVAVVNSSFQVERYINGIATGNTTYGGRFAMIFSPDYADNKLVMLQSHASGFQINSCRHYIVSGANGAILANNVLDLSSGFTNQNGNVPSIASFYYDTNYIFIKYNPGNTYVLSTTSTNAGIQAVMYTSNLQVITTNTLGSSTQGVWESSDSYSGVIGYAPFKCREAMPFKGYRLSNSHRGVSYPIAESFFTTNYDHAGETTINIGISASNTFSNNLPFANGGVCFTDGVWYYRFNNNVIRNASKVYGQYRDKNNLGFKTPSILISS